jgi:hypothetical protein
MKKVRSYQGLRSWNQLLPQRSECGSQRLEFKVSFEPIGSREDSIQVVQKALQAQP